MATPIGGCYLLHFDGRVLGKQHYLGWSVHILRRVRVHLRGKGARLVRQALNAGLQVELVRVWPGLDQRGERLLKRRTPKSYCPLCAGQQRPQPRRARSPRQPGPR